MAFFSDLVKVMLSLMIGATVLLTFADVQIPWNEVPPVVKILVYLMGLDWASGVARSWMERKVSSKIGARGLMRKGLVLVLLLSAALLEKALGTDYHLESFGSFAYCVNEFISIIENCDKCGVPIPKALVQALLSAKQFRFQKLSRSELAELDTNEALREERSRRTE